MTPQDITATIERALSASSLGQARRPLVDQISKTIRDALNAAGLHQSPDVAKDSEEGSRAVMRLKQPSLPIEQDRHHVPGKMLDCSFSNGQAHRDYKLFVPSSFSGAPMPLVVMLHGCKQSADDFARGTRMNELAQEQGFIVAYPDQPVRANGSNCWNWFVPSEQARGGEEPSLIAGIARHVGGSHAVDESKVFVAGLSAGAAMAAIVGATYPQVFKAVGVHSGLPVGAAHDVPSAFAAMQGAMTATKFGGRPGRDKERFVNSSVAGVRTIVFHGDADTTVNGANGRKVVSDALRGFTEDGGVVLTEVTEQSASSGRATTVTTYQDEAGRVVVESWTIKGAGHAWSGGSPAGSFTDAKGPDASREMVRFFLAG